MLNLSTSEGKDVDDNSPDPQSLTSSSDPLSTSSTFKDDSSPSSDSSSHSKIHHMFKGSSKLSLTSEEGESPPLEKKVDDTENTATNNKRLVSDMDFSPRPETSTGMFLPKNNKAAPKFDTEESAKNGENKEQSNSPLYSSPESFRSYTVAFLEDEEEDESKLKDKPSGMLKKVITKTSKFFFSTSF